MFELDLWVSVWPGKNNKMLFVRGLKYIWTDETRYVNTPYKKKHDVLIQSDLILGIIKNDYYFENFITFFNARILHTQIFFLLLTA